MLTCKTPPNTFPSKQSVKLTVDSVERLAPQMFTYNQDPIINSIQPSRSFVRSELCSLRTGFTAELKIYSPHLYGGQRCFPEMVWIWLFVNDSSTNILQTWSPKCFFTQTEERGRGKRGRVWLRISANEQRQINASRLQQEEMSRRWRVAKLLTLTAGPSRWGSTVSTLSDADTYIRSHPPYCSGGCTVAAHGFFLQSGLQPQMVLTTGQDEEVFHVVSTTRVSYPKWWQSELTSSFGLAIKQPINGLDPVCEIILFRNILT